MNKQNKITSAPPSCSARRDHIVGYYEAEEENPPFPGGNNHDDDVEHEWPEMNMNKAYSCEKLTHQNGIVEKAVLRTKGERK